MKNFFAISLSLCAVLILFGCASKPPASSGMPAKVATARKDAPADVLVGIGTAKMGTKAQTMIIAQTRARADLSNTMGILVKNMVRDYTASSEVDPNVALAFQENLTVTLSKADLSGAVIWFEEEEKDGQLWCVMHLSKANVVKEITQAQAAARLAVPAMASFDAERRMNEAFEQLLKEGY
jgi:hypothetical protein